VTEFGDEHPDLAQPALIGVEAEATVQATFARRDGDPFDRPGESIASLPRQGR
jgi:hypothetical protein